MITRLLPIGLFLLLLTGCATGPKDHFESRPVTFQELSGWAQDDHLEAVQVFIKSCEVLGRKSRAATVGSDIQVREPVWKSLCEDAKKATNPAQAKTFFERRFVPYRIANNKNERGLFTGYYEPVLFGSLKKTGDFKYPLYAPPPELKDSKPYLTHAEIVAGGLKGRGLEILWVDDPVMLFFMQIQGSGRVKLKDGRELRVGYADQNGHPYGSLGKIFGDENILPKDQINFFTIRQWLYNNPSQAMAMMQRNPSYVFFKIIDKPEGPFGAVGVALTPMRSLAVDDEYIPYGLPLYLETQLPPKNAPFPFKRLMIAQDTGGAIRSPVRGDVFFGAGDRAEYLAGYMAMRGVYTMLVPHEIASQMR
jgi:membrane-bound lytic murein transglycosylase A